MNSGMYIFLSHMLVTNTLTRRPVVRSRTMKDGRQINKSFINSFQLMYSKFEYDGELNPHFTEGDFNLELRDILAYSTQGVTSDFIVFTQEDIDKKVLVCNNVCANTTGKFI
jgi:hypothetical protein